MTQQLDRHDSTKVPGLRLYFTPSNKSERFDGLRGHFLRLSSQMGLSGSPREARRLLPMIPTRSPRIRRALLSHRDVYLPLRWH